MLGLIWVLLNDVRPGLGLVLRFKVGIDLICMPKRGLAPASTLTFQAGRCNAQQPGRWIEHLGCRPKDSEVRLGGLS